MNLEIITRVIFFILAFISVLIYSFGAFDIFHKFNIKDGIKKEEETNFKNAPRLWKLELHMHVFIGVVIGWIAMWILVDKRLHLFSSNSDYTQLGFPDLILFLIGFVGINGRLPTIAHTIQDWFNPVGIIKAIKGH